METTSSCSYSRAAALIIIKALDVNRKCKEHNESNVLLRLPGRVGPSSNDRKNRNMSNRALLGWDLFDCSDGNPHCLSIDPFRDRLDQVRWSHSDKIQIMESFDHTQSRQINNNLIWNRKIDQIIRTTTNDTTTVLSSRLSSPSCGKTSNKSQKWKERLAKKRQSTVTTLEEKHKNSNDIHHTVVASQHSLQFPEKWKRLSDCEDSIISSTWEDDVALPKDHETSFTDSSTTNSFPVLDSSFKLDDTSMTNTMLPLPKNHVLKSKDGTEECERMTPISQESIMGHCKQLRPARFHLDSLITSLNCHIVTQSRDGSISRSKSDFLVVLPSAIKDGGNAKIRKDHYFLTDSTVRDQSSRYNIDPMTTNILFHSIIVDAWNVKQNQKPLDRSLSNLDLDDDVAKQQCHEKRDRSYSRKSSKAMKWKERLARKHERMEHTLKDDEKGEEQNHQSSHLSGNEHYSMDSKLMVSVQCTESAAKTEANFLIDNTTQSSLKPTYHYLSSQADHSEKQTSENFYNESQDVTRSPYVPSSPPNHTTDQHWSEKDIEYEVKYPLHLDPWGTHFTCHSAFRLSSPSVSKDVVSALVLLPSSIEHDAKRSINCMTKKYFFYGNSPEIMDRNHFSIWTIDPMITMLLDFVMTNGRNGEQNQALSPRSISNFEIQTPNKEILNSGQNQMIVYKSKVDIDYPTSPNDSCNTRSNKIKKWEDKVMKECVRTDTVGEKIEGEEITPNPMLLEDENTYLQLEFGLDTPERETNKSESMLVTTNSVPLLMTPFDDFSSQNIDCGEQSLARFFFPCAPRGVSTTAGVPLPSDNDCMDQDGPIPNETAKPLSKWNSRSSTTVAVPESKTQKWKNRLAKKAMQQSGNHSILSRENPPFDEKVQKDEFSPNTATIDAIQDVSTMKTSSWFAGTLSTNTRSCMDILEQEMQVTSGYENDESSIGTLQSDFLTIEPDLSEDYASTHSYEERVSKDLDQSDPTLSSLSVSHHDILEQEIRALDSDCSVESPLLEVSASPENNVSGDADPSKQRKQEREGNAYIVSPSKAQKWKQRLASKKARRRVAPEHNIAFCEVNHGPDSVLNNTTDDHPSEKPHSDCEHILCNDAIYDTTEADIVLGDEHHQLATTAPASETIQDSISESNLVSTDDKEQNQLIDEEIEKTESPAGFDFDQFQVLKDAVETEMNDPEEDNECIELVIRINGSDWNQEDDSDLSTGDVSCQNGLRHAKSLFGKDRSAPDFEEYSDATTEVDESSRDEDGSSEVTILISNIANRGGYKGDVNAKGTPATVTNTTAANDTLADGPVTNGPTRNGAALDSMKSDVTKSYKGDEVPQSPRTCIWCCLFF